MSAHQSANQTPKPDNLREALYEIMNRRNQKILAAQKTDALVLPYFEADNEAADEILDLFATQTAQLKQRVLEKLPKEIDMKNVAYQKDRQPQFYVAGHNAALSEVRAIIEGEKNA